jgi:type IV secretory pathway TrbL component
MKKLALGVVVAMGLGAAACGNPCDKLAKAVCDKVKDAKICDSMKEKAKKADKNHKDKCKEQLKDVDKVVAGLQMAEKMKDMFKNLGQKVMGGAQPAPAPAPAPAAPAPAAPAPAPAPAAPAPAK